MTFLSDMERAAAWSERFRPLVLVERGGVVDAVHRGAIAIVRPDRSLKSGVGDADTVVYMRSSTKPLQLLPVVESGAVERFGFTPAELAVMAGSHDGSPEAVAAVASVLQRIGLDESALACGAHAPFSRPAALALDLRGEKPRPIHNNCSGKHAGMLALARQRGYAIEGYYLPAHPVQVEVLGAIADMAGLALGTTEVVTTRRAPEVAVGVDGCGVPTFGVPLRAAALMFARLVNPAGLGAARAAACRRIVAAMQAHPQLVSGRGRMCTVLMSTLAGKLVSKGGAEGFYAFGVLPGVLPAEPAGLGVALKIEHGDSPRGLSLATIETIRQLGLTDEAGLQALWRAFPPEISNHRGEVVGRSRPAFDL